MRTMAVVINTAIYSDARQSALGPLCLLPCFSSWLTYHLNMNKFCLHLKHQFLRLPSQSNSHLLLKITLFYTLFVELMFFFLGYNTHNIHRNHLYAIVLPPRPFSEDTGHILFICVLPKDFSIAPFLFLTINKYELN